MHTIFVHIINDEPVLGEVEILPDPKDTSIYLSNPRRRDGKDLHYVLPEVQSIIIPWHRIIFVEIMPSGEEEEIISPFG